MCIPLLNRVLGENNLKNDTAASAQIDTKKNRRQMIGFVRLHFEHWDSLRKTKDSKFSISLSSFAFITLDALLHPATPHLIAELHYF